ncbi:RDD family protein [Nostocoides sp. F2B08]|uniref:RDD family protein n=1 Tax=Nostocoides sp. F2B08 TaxID=2653936 RepID=UPI0012635651|nr:RDD family protein [Tetrasphaera sp. F2B08]KAB7743031.1 RDD family protein [Tetrasphaera sp. F2B08]
MMSDGSLSPVPREARPYQGKRAGVVTRMVAAAIDGAVVTTLLLAGYAAFSITLFLIDPRQFSFPDVGLLFSLTSAFAVLVVYQTLAWWLVGRTYGGRVMGLRVVSFRGRRQRLSGALVRSLFCTVFPIGLLWVAVSRENRSVQDMVLRTSVIYDWQPRAPQGPEPSGDERPGSGGTQRPVSGT